MEYHDVLSAFSMSYSGGDPLPPPPLARPRRQPSIKEEGERRHSIIKPDLRDPEVKELPSTAVVKPAATRPHQDDDEPRRRGFQEQPQPLQGRLLSPDARACSSVIGTVSPLKWCIQCCGLAPRNIFALTEVYEAPSHKKHAAAV